jgi:hypothetical protein
MKYQISSEPVKIEIRVFEQDGRLVALGKSDFDQIVTKAKERKQENGKDIAIFDEGKIEATVEHAEFIRPSWRLMAKMESLATVGSLDTYGYVDRVKLTFEQFRRCLQKTSLFDFKLTSDVDGDQVMSVSDLEKVIGDKGLPPIILNVLIQEFRSQI